jgi:hypothetical protein
MRLRVMSCSGVSLGFKMFVHVYQLARLSDLGNKLLEFRFKAVLIVTKTLAEYKSRTTKVHSIINPFSLRVE